MSTHTLIVIVFLSFTASVKPGAIGTYTPLVGNGLYSGNQVKFHAAELWESRRVKSDKRVSVFSIIGSAESSI